MKAGGRITPLRRLTQIFFFFLLLYAASAGLRHVEVKWLPFIKKPLSFDPDTAMGFFRGPAYQQILDTYLPIKTCRFVRESGLFRGCQTHFLSESISWLSPVRDFLPHLLLLLFLSFMLGRFWCGWICPMGTISDYLGILRKRLGLPKLSLPEGLRNLLRLSGYILLSVILLTSIIAACEFLPWKIRHSLYIAGCQMCPSRFTFPYLVGFPIVHTFGGPGLVPAILIILFCIAIIFTSLLGLGFIFRRPWCMVCPNGVLLSIFNRGSMITKEKESLRCTGCGACFNGCSMQGDFIYHQRRQRIVNHADCILCFRCVDLCPQGDCLKVKFMGLVIFRSK